MNENEIGYQFYILRKFQKLPYCYLSVTNIFQHTFVIVFYWVKIPEMAFSFAQDDAEEELLAKALYVEDASDASVPFDPTKPPATAEEYLKSVMQEAKHLEGVAIGKYSQYRIE